MTAGARGPAAIGGASSGIGEATAVALAAAGHPVVLGARRIDRCEEVAARIRDEGGRAHALPLDVTDPDSAAAFAKGAGEAFGPVEVLVVSAGDVQPAGALDADAFAAQVDLHLVGVHRVVSLLVPPMVERRRGDVVFLSSDSVRLPRPRLAGYVAAKWAIEGLARVVQMELEGTGVRASIVRPGPTLTGMGRDWSPELLDDLFTEWRSWGFHRHDGYLAPEGVAAAVVAVVTAPRGTHLTLVEVEPEAPLSKGDG